jgi:molybdopterin-binding protein
VQAVHQGIVQVTTPIGIIEAAAELAPGCHVTLCLRPEDLILHRASQAPQLSDAGNLVPGTVAKIMPWGLQARVMIDSGMPLTALVTWHAMAALDLQPGQQVLVAFKASAVHVMQHYNRVVQQ